MKRSLDDAELVVLYNNLKKIEEIISATEQPFNKVISLLEIQGHQSTESEEVRAEMIMNSMDELLCGCSTAEDTFNDICSFVKFGKRVKIE